ncbi:MAG TPA: hypothetical protein VGU61_00470, partial [Noviherbaspirillum sp.]|uniref:hypothetical protein n=1 Tax=Noviherbaspirillum sp. TaxID=1926288 RepID=UPI002DDDAC93
RRDDVLPASALHEAGSNSPYPRMQAHAGPHWHCGPQAQVAFCAACCVGGFWQPQVQLRPGQLMQLHGVWLVAFIMFLLTVGNEMPV